jgi:hypothetical protein
MKILDRGRRYELSAGNHLAFLQKGGDSVIRDGTTNEEVLEVLIDRTTEACHAKRAFVRCTCCRKRWRHSGHARRGELPPVSKAPNTPTSIALNRPTQPPCIRWRP